MKRRPSHETTAEAARQQRQSSGAQRERYVTCLPWFLCHVPCASLLMLDSFVSTLSQREQEYEQARAAIFESQQAEAEAAAAQSNGAAVPEAGRPESQSASRTNPRKGGGRRPQGGSRHAANTR
jgi:hypothetical protein